MPAPLHLPDRLLHDPHPLVIAYTVLSIDPARATRPATLEARIGYAYACLPTLVEDRQRELARSQLNIIIDTYLDVRRGRTAGLTPASTTLIRKRARLVRGEEERHE